MFMFLSNRRSLSHRTRLISTTVASFKHTLQLPNGDLPERLTQDPALWSEVYQWQKGRQHLPLFTLHDGPPFANGDLHMGHFLNKTIKDIIIRQKIMSGHRVDYRPGWDCHGLPIECKVKQVADCTDPTWIRKASEDLASNVISQHKKEMKSWSLIADYDNHYTTMSKEYEAAQLAIFSKIAARGLLRRERKPVYWSPSSLTALAEAELEYRSDHVSTAAYVAFPLIKKLEAEDPLLGGASALIWTTTPWTLAANAAVAFDPKATYSVVMNGKGKFIVGSCRIESLQEILGPEPLTVLGQISTSQLSSYRCQHPLQNQCSVPLVTSPFVSDDVGTGLVHTAPGHGKEDHIVGRQHGLPVLSPVDKEGKFTSEVGFPDLIGKFVLGAGQRAILDFLSSKQTLLHSTQYTHSYPYDWRTKQPVITLSTPQWFCELEGGIRDAAMSALQDVTMIPDGGQRLRSMVVSRDEWCISRQRYWGLPIPVFYHVETGKPLMTERSIDHIRGLFAQHGSKCWWTMSVAELLAPEYRSDAHDYVRSNDTLDVWFDSGTSWSSVMGGAVSDLVVEGSDQHRGWFQSSLLTRIASGDGKAPFRQILTHGFVLDERARKMSKSVGNVVDPRDLLSEGKFSLDTLRVWVGCSDITGDVIIGPTSLDNAKASLRRLRNCARFMLGCLADFSPDDRVAYDDLHSFDRYALFELGLLCTEIDAAYLSFQHNKVMAALNRFIGAFFSPLYAHASKDRLYAEAKTSQSRRSSQTVLYEVLNIINMAIAPIAPQTGEDIYQQKLLTVMKNLHQGDHPQSILTQGWSIAPDIWTANGEFAKQWHSVLRLRDIVNKMLETVRNQKLIGNSLQAQLVIDIQDSQISAFIDQIGNDALAEVLSVSSVSISNRAPSEVPFLQETHEFVDVDGRSLLKASVSIASAKGGKCARCWKYAPLSDAEICQRCQTAIGIQEPTQPHKKTQTRTPPFQ